MIKLIPAENESPAFCILKGKLLVPVTYYLYHKALKYLIIRIFLTKFVVLWVKPASDNVDSF
jgi:hypothetical protein